MKIQNGKKNILRGSILAVVIGIAATQAFGQIRDWFKVSGDSIEFTVIWEPPKITTDIEKYAIGVCLNAYFAPIDSVVPQWIKFVHKDSVSTKLKLYFDPRFELGGWEYWASVASVDKSGNYSKIISDWAGVPYLLADVYHTQNNDVTAGDQVKLDDIYRRSLLLKFKSLRKK